MAKLDPSTSSSSSTSLAIPVGPLTFRAREAGPKDGPLVLLVDGKDRTLGERIARQIYVRLTRNGKAPKGIESPVNGTKQTNTPTTTVANQKEREGTP